MHIVRPQVAVQSALLLGGHEDRADAVDNGLGDARRAGRVVDDHGVLEADADDGRGAGEAGPGL